MHAAMAQSLKVVCEPLRLHSFVLLLTAIAGHAVYGTPTTACADSAGAACSATAGQVLLQSGQRGMKVAQDGQELQPVAEVQLEDGVKMVRGVPIYNYDKRGLVKGLNLLEDDDSVELEWLVRFSDGCQSQCLKNTCAKIKNISNAHCVFEASEGGMSFDVISGTEADVDAIIEAIDGIEFIEPSLEVHEVPEVDDEDSLSFVQENADTNKSSTPWNLAALMSTSNSNSAAFAPKFGQKGKGVHVYVVDTGIRYTHNEFEGRAIPTLDVTVNPIVVCAANDKTCAADPKGHGTHVAATVGGKTKGVAPKATLHSVRVLKDDGTGASCWFAEAFDWVATHAQKPAVIQASVAATGTSKAIRMAVDASTAAGIAVIVAAGNENDDACQYSPGDAGMSIAVAAHTKWWKRSNQISNYGPCVDIYAPGVGVESACHGSDTAYCSKTGTSMAAPHVSGVAALLLARANKLDAVGVKTLLQLMSRSDEINSNAPMTVNQRLFIPAKVPKLPATTTTTTAAATGFLVTEGACIAEGECVMSPNYPDKYENIQKCVIKAKADFFDDQTISVWAFKTENIYDKLWVNGQAYSGNVGPEGIKPQTDIVWQSDYGTTNKGWKLCGSGTAKEVFVARHLGQNCLSSCGGSGYCLGTKSWCGVGNACCKYGSADNPSECSLMGGYVTSKTHHQCVSPGAWTPPTPQPTTPPLPAGAACKGWCAGHGDPWTTKCTWINCAACAKCF